MKIEKAEKFDLNNISLENRAVKKVVKDHKERNLIIIWDDGEVIIDTEALAEAGFTSIIPNKTGYDFKLAEIDK